MILATTEPAASMGWIEAALVIFFVVFVVIIIGVVLRKRGHFDAAARIPLDDDVTTPRDEQARDEEQQGATP